MAGVSVKNAKVYICAGIILTLVPPLVQYAIGHFFHVPGVVTLFFVTGSMTALAFVFIDGETIRFGLHSLLLLLFGICIAVALVFVKGYGRFDVETIDPVIDAIGIINLCVIIPFYEELVVRRFLFVGVARFVRPVLAAVLISVLFGFAHGKMSHNTVPIFAFLLSLLLCYLTYRNVDTANRAILHGAINLTIPIIVLMHGRI